MKKDKIIIVTAIIVCIIGAFFTFRNILGSMNTGDPVSAAGMTVDERGEFDTKGIEKGIKSSLDDSLYSSIEKININYKYDSITIYTNINKTDQYSENDGNNIESAIDDFLNNHRSKVTLENSSYSIHVKGKDSIFDLNK